MVDEWESGSWKQIASLGQNSLSDPVSGLSSGTNYSFEVAATNSNTNAAGPDFAASQTAETYTAAPTLAATAVSGTQINLSWGKVTGATAYVVDELIGGNWKPIQTLGSSSTGYSVTALSPGVTYTFKVGATDTAGTEFSKSENATTK